jgi:LysR family transcriptional regulator, regulator for metE and metH
MKLELRHLNLVRMVVEEGGLTRAGRRLGISQSALSHQLRDIEEQLGVSLFHRVGRRLALAPAGDRILRAARLVLPEIERAELDLGQDSSQMLGTIRIGVEDDSCYCWLPGILRRFGRKYPNTELRLATASAEKPFQSLRQNELDLAVISQPARENQIKFYELFEDELFAVLAAGHSLADKKYLQPKDFGSETVFCSGPFSESLLYQRVLRPAGIRPREVMQVKLTEANLELVKYGFGVAVLARSALQPYLPIGEVRGVRITLHGLRRTWSAATRAGKKPPEYLAALVEAFQNESAAVAQ